MAEKPLQSLTIQGLNDIYVNTPLSTAPTFDTTQSYAVDDCVFYNKKLYKFTSAHPAGAWNNAHVTEITVGGELSTINQDISDLSGTVSGKYSKPSTGIPASDLASGVIPDVSGKADKVSGATSGNFASLDANGNPADSGKKPSDFLTEHQDLTDYVKNTDYAGALKGGVVKLSGYGLRIGAIQSGDGILWIYKAEDNHVKNGNHQYNPIVPYNQHMATFYGLAKAAGDTTQSSSSNAVGTYTEDAKIKIQKMLGIYEAPWELIREDTFTNETEADHVITVDGNGNAFQLTDMALMFETPKQETYSAKGSSGLIKITIGTSEILTEVGAWTQNANTDSHGTYVFVEQNKGLVTTHYSSSVNYATSKAVDSYRYLGFGNKYYEGGVFLTNEERYITKINIVKVIGTGHYKLYGKRKWS